MTLGKKAIKSFTKAESIFDSIITFARNFAHVSNNVSNVSNKEKVYYSV